MSDGSLKEVSKVVRGDSVKTPHGCSRVKCVLKMRVPPGKTYCVSQINSLFIGSMCPIKYSEEWVLPDAVSKGIPTTVSTVYAFVLEEHHIINVENYDVVCVGHGYTQGVLKMSEWGKKEYITQLDMESGHVEIDRLIC